ncbi:MAG: hypothetical protein ABFS23_02240 [Pseudomonadota bacterium]
MLSLIQFFFQLCLLKARPQELPASPVLLALVAAINVLVGIAVAAGSLGDTLTGLLASLVDAALLALVLWILLKAWGHPARFLQTATAAFGVSAMISVLSLPLQLLVIDAGDEPGVLASIAGLMFLVLVIWLQVALGNVLRHALGTSLLFGVGLAFLYALVSGTVIQRLFPVSL